MKKLLASLLLIAALPALAQFNTGSPVTGTTNVPLIVGSTIPTNTAYFFLPSKYLMLSGVASTNEVAIFSYGFTVAGQTNPIILGSLTNAFTLANGGTNGGTWSTNIPAMSFNVPIVPWAQSAIGAYTNIILTVP